MTSPAQAQRLVLISVFALLGIATYRGKLSDAQVSATKRLWGTGVLAIMLGLVADVAPQVAGPFAVLVVVGSLTKGGDKALTNFLGKASGSGAAASRPAAPAGGGGGGPAPKPQ